MKKDVNFTLFGIITLLLFSIVGVTIYYNLTYQRLDSDYREAIDDVRRTKDELNRTAEEIILKSEELVKKENDLIDLINELNLSKQQVTSLGGYYTDLKGEKESIEANIDQIRGERDTWKSEYTSANVDLEYCERSYGAMQIKFSTVNSSLTRFQEMGDDIVEYANEGKGYTAELDIQASEITESITELRTQINRLDTACENGSINEIEGNIASIRDDIYDANDEIEKMMDNLNDILNMIKNRAT